MNMFHKWPPGPRLPWIGPPGALLKISPIFGAKVLWFTCDQPSTFEVKRDRYPNER